MSVLTTRPGRILTSTWTQSRSVGLSLMPTTRPTSTPRYFTNDPTVRPLMDVSRKVITKTSPGSLSLGRRKNPATITKMTVARDRKIPSRVFCSCVIMMTLPKEECPDEVVAGTVQVGVLPGEAKTAVIEEQDAVGHPVDRAQLVGDDDERHPAALLESQEEIV